MAFGFLNPFKMAKKGLSLTQGLAKRYTPRGIPVPGVNTGFRPPSLGGALGMARNAANPRNLLPGGGAPPVPQSQPMQSLAPGMANGMGGGPMQVGQGKFGNIAQGVSNVFGGAMAQPAPQPTPALQPATENPEAPQQYPGAWRGGFRRGRMGF